MTAAYPLTDDVIALPTGAWAATHRRTLRREGRPVLALSQGRHRAYVYPLFTPHGYAVTSEHPADHPHHNSFWIAADHLYCRMPVAHGKGYEEYTYNLYLNEHSRDARPDEYWRHGAKGGTTAKHFTSCKRLTGAARLNGRRRMAGSLPVRQGRCMLRRKAACM